MDEIGDNIELQLLVKETISDYRQNVQRAKVAGCTLADCVQATIKSRKRKSADDAEEDEEEQEAQEDITGTLRRGQLIFGNWSAKLLNQCMRFCDGQAIDAQVCKILSKVSKQEMMETAFDLRMFGDEQDRVGTDDKKFLFENLKKVYEKNGSRWRHMSIDSDTGKILYDVAAPWMIVETIAEPVLVKLKLNGWANFDKETVIELGAQQLFDDKGPFELLRPYSVRHAALLSASTKETYTLATFLPRQRKLEARPSDAEGASSLARKSYAQAKQDLKEQRTNAGKSKSSGVKTLGGGVLASATELCAESVSSHEEKQNSGKGSGKALGSRPASAKSKLQKQHDVASASAATTEPESPPPSPEP